MRFPPRTAASLAVCALAIFGCQRPRTLAFQHEIARWPYVYPPPADDKAPTWDGHGWVTIMHHHHGDGCGHCYYHGAWNVCCEEEICDRAGFAPFDLYVDHTHDPDHAWDGERWICIEGHVHGPDCGHSFHHEAWHLHDPTYRYARTDLRPFGERSIMAPGERVISGPGN